MNENLKDQDVLLVKEEGSNKMYAPNLDENGDARKQEIKKGANPDFLKFDANANAAVNFFKNFVNQVENPTRFDFFRAPVDKVQEVIQKLQTAFKNPDKPENKEFIDMHRVKPEDFMENPQMYQQEIAAKPYNAIHEDHVDWEQLESIGINRETLEKTNNLEKFLNWQKTDLLPITVKTDEVTVRTEARLALRESSPETLTLAVHALRSKPELERPYFGIKFTEEDKKNLRETRNYWNSDT